MKPSLLSTASEQARMAQLFNHVRDGVVMLDPGAIVGFWSAGAAEILGRSASEALNRCYLELLSPRCRVVQVPHIQRALEGEDCAVEWQTTGPDGKPMWLEGDFRPVFDPFGKRIGCSILLHNVTRWHTAEKARKASDDLLRGITDSLPGAVFQIRVGADGSRSAPFFSRGGEDLLERTSAESDAAVASGDVLVVSEDRSAFWDSMEHSRKSLSMWEGEFRIRTAKTNQPKWVRLRAVPSRQSDGSTVWNGVLTDVSREVAAAGALRESEARYRLLTENATDLIARVNPAGIFLYVSPASQTLLGIPPNEFVGRHIRDFIHEADLPRLLEFFDRLPSGQIENTYSHQCRTNDGSYVWCESTARAVRDADGTVTEFVTVTRSIEERRKLEAKAQNSQKLQAVGRLAGGVAHDFNNLLTVINGFSEMILRGLANPDPARIGSQVQEIHKAGERASVLTRQLLAFGRQQVQSRTRVNLNEVIDEAMKLVGRVLGEDVEIETDYCLDLNAVHADVGQIEQVLMNLAVNAREAMPDGGVLTLSTANVRFDTSPEEEVRSGDYVMLAVADTGNGMDDTTRSRAFEPFFTTKELGKGTGLGLAMVYGIVKQSDGHIVIESEIGRGTTFRIYLPRTVTLADGYVRRPSSIIRTGRETILLVEDDDSVRSVTASILRSLGYCVIEATGGPDALRHCREHSGPIHLLLTDIVMPLMNGREVAERVQVLLPGVKTLFMSGYTDDSILRNGVLDASVPFLSKPLTHDSLRHKVREVLNQVASSVS